MAADKPKMPKTKMTEPRPHGNKIPMEERLSTYHEGDRGLTLEELPTALAAQNIDYTMYREDSRQDLILERLQQRDVISRITITPREMELCLARTSLNQADSFDYNVSHILISIPAASTQQDIQTAPQPIH